MFNPDQYALLDFGRGRKLERFGAYTLDRTAPAADEASIASVEAWRGANATYERLDAERGAWQTPANAPETWTIHHGSLVFELRRTDFGQVGLFPEQAANWDWLEQVVRGAQRPLKVLNLFAYTGGSSLAAAAAGAEVVHIDAARNVVQWARRNAELSGLADRPIRWIAEDAAKFVARELKRGHAYDAVILDPPSYGHGTSGEVWKLADHLPALLADCRRLTSARRAFILLSCHTPGYGPRQLRELLRAHIGPGQVKVQSLDLVSASGRTLPSGVAARWLPAQVAS
jgi:23S rRNA (cytosine1962-C5)-methyltransferase